MVGTKQFDHDTVVDRAMMLFWRRGYGGTSIQDLESATRLRRGSLYNAFGDKQGLFVAALKRYESTVGHERIKQLSNPDPYRAIEGFLDTLVTQMSNPSRPRGCLHTNTSLEFPNAPDEVLRIIAERTAGIEGAISDGAGRVAVLNIIDVMVYSPANDFRIEFAVEHGSVVLGQPNQPWKDRSSDLRRPSVGFKIHGQRHVFLPPINHRC